jgi:hypothetical protein
MAETQISANEHKCSQEPQAESKFPCQTNSKSPDSLDEPQMAQKSLPTTKKRKGKTEGALIRENSGRSDFWYPTVQIFFPCHTR